MRRLEYERRVADESKSNSNGHQSAKPPQDPSSSFDNNTVNTDDVLCSQNKQQESIDKLKKENEELKEKAKLQELKMNFLSKEIDYANQPIGYDVGSAQLT